MIFHKMVNIKIQWEIITEQSSVDAQVTQRSPLTEIPSLSAIVPES